MSEKKKKKSKIVSFRVNEEEYELMVSIAESANMKLSEYLKIRAIEGRIHQPKLSNEVAKEVVPNLRKLTDQVQRIGHNINQSTKALNQIKKRLILAPSEVLDDIKKLEQQTAKFEEINKGVNDIWLTLK